MQQNYPNPFNQSTAIRYVLPESKNVVLRVYDLNGRVVKTLVNTTQDAGAYTVDFNSAGLSSGKYLYRLEANGESRART